MKLCLLREAWNVSGNDPLLPPSPLAVLGSIVHKLLEAAGRGQLQGRQPANIEETWERLLNKAEKKMSQSTLEQTQVPLKKSIPDFEVRKLRACRKAAEIALDADCANKSRVAPYPQLAGVELWVQTDDGTVGGYIDRVKITE